MNDYSLTEFRNGMISLCHAGMFPDKYDSYLYVNHKKIRADLQKALRDALRICLTHISQHHPDIRAEKATKICYYRECGYGDEQTLIKYSQRNTRRLLLRLKQLLNSVNRVFAVHKIALK